MGEKSRMSSRLRSYLLVRKGRRWGMRMWRACWPLRRGISFIEIRIEVNEVTAGFLTT